MMALKMTTAEALCFILAVSVGQSIGLGYYGSADPSGLNTNSSIRSGLIRSQGPNSTSSSGGDGFLVLPGSAGISSSGAVSGTGSVTGNLGGSTPQDSNSGFAGSVSGANLGASSGSLNGPIVSGLRPSGNAASAGQLEQRIVNIPGSLGSGVGPATVLEAALTEDFLQEPVTITEETTVDVFKTISNIIYNSVPITLTEFIKTTEVAPTLQVISTPVDDRVFVATAPVTFTQTVTVTNTNTGYLYATEVSTDVYTVTHKAYEIRQKLITSTLQQTQVFRPTIVRTRINTEYDTQTVEQTIFNTIVIQPRTALPISTSTTSFTRTLLSNQLFVGQEQPLASQGGGQQNLFVGQSQASGSGSQFQQTSGQVSNADQRSQQLLNVQLSEQDVRQFPVLGRVNGNQFAVQGQQFAGQGQQFAGQGRGQQNLFVSQSQASGSGSQLQQSSGQVSSADQRSQQLLNLQFAEQDVRQFPVLGRVREGLI